MFEDRTLRRESIEPRRHAGWKSVGSQVIGAGRVERDDEQIHVATPATRRERRTRILSGASALPGERADDQKDRHDAKDPRDRESTLRVRRIG
jgi:hypothetical protein